MHTIDLLRGEGIPLRTTPAGIIVAVVTVLVPLCVAAGMVDRYLNNINLIDIETYALAREQARIDSYSDAARAKAALESQKARIEKTLEEVARFANRHIQWSPILTTVAKDIPENMIITTLEAVCKNTTAIVPHQTEPNTNVRVTIPKRSLVIDMAGKQSEDHDGVMIDFRDKLVKSAELGSKLQDVVISRESDKTVEQGGTSYKAVCVFEQKR